MTTAYQPLLKHLTIYVYTGYTFFWLEKILLFMCTIVIKILMFNLKYMV